MAQAIAVEKRHEDRVNNTIIARVKEMLHYIGDAPEVYRDLSFYLCGEPGWDKNADPDMLTLDMQNGLTTVIMGIESVFTLRSNNMFQSNMRFTRKNGEEVFAYELLTYSQLAELFETDEWLFKEFINTDDMVWPFKTYLAQFNRIIESYAM